MTITDPNPVAVIGAADVDWDTAVVYQVYLRSFRDSDGDGIGDLRGLTEGLPAIADLGCDAIWLNPCYVSPQRDHGYDIADYTAIDPAYGSLPDFDELVARAHDLGIKVLMDMVANHCSEQHPWFQEALASAPGGPARDRFLFRDGRGPAGDESPNNWQSVFGGPAWTRVGTQDGQWYLHSFDPGQPDLNWRNPEVARYFENVLRFWFDRGVDGFRIDVAHGMVKAPDLPDHRPDADGGFGHNHAMWDQPEVHDIYRAWRALGDSYTPRKHFVGEIWVPSPGRLADYLRPDELHQAFWFDLLIQPWSAPHFRTAIEHGLATAGPSPAWTLANHDVHRTVTRYGQAQILDTPDPSDMIAAARRVGDVDLALGVRRAQAAAGLLLALPGTAYLYQGEELGLPEVFDLPDAARQDPIWHRSGGAELGRDGCRVPLPWRAGAPSAGFSSGADTWLPQPASFAEFARETQAADPHSTLSAYRALLAARRSLFAGGAPLEWVDAPDGALAFRRGDALCVTNMTSQPFPLPGHLGAGDLVVATSPLSSPTVLPPDTTAWFHRKFMVPPHVTAPSMSPLMTPTSSPR